MGVDELGRDVFSRVLYGGEEGLLSVAFHPGYATNHYFYVDYTHSNTAGDTVYTMVEGRAIYAPVKADKGINAAYYDAADKLVVMVRYPERPEGAVVLEWKAGH